MPKHLSLLFLALILAWGCLRAEPTGQELIEGFDLQEGEVRQLLDGEILAFSDEEFESSKRELAADAMVYVKADHATVLDSMDDDTTLIPHKYLIEHRLIESSADFEDVAFTADEFDEVEKLFGGKIGKDFNLSAAEQAMVRKILAPARNASADDQLAAASDAMKALLVGRYEAYRESGIPGIAPYDRSKRKAVDVGAELQLTNDATEPFKEEFPEFVRLLMNYPEGADCCRHEYRWLKVRLHKRPAFAISHTMLQGTDEYALVTERYFYVTNSLNSVQITVAWVPYEDGGSVGLAISASADVLTSTLGRMLRPVGRNKAKDLVSDAMRDVRTDLETRTEGPEQ